MDKATAGDTEVVPPPLLCHVPLTNREHSMRQPFPGDHASRAPFHGSEKTPVRLPGLDSRTPSCLESDQRPLSSDPHPSFPDSFPDSLTRTSMASRLDRPLKALGPSRPDHDLNLPLTPHRSTTTRTRTQTRQSTAPPRRRSRPHPPLRTVSSPFSRAQATPSPFPAPLSHVMYIPRRRASLSWATTRPTRVKMILTRSRSRASRSHQRKQRYTLICMPSTFR